MPLATRLPALIKTSSIVLSGTVVHVVPDAEVSEISREKHLFVKVHVQSINQRAKGNISHAIPLTKKKAKPNLPTLLNQRVVFSESGACVAVISLMTESPLIDDVQVAGTAGWPEPPGCHRTD